MALGCNGVPKLVIFTSILNIFICETICTCLTHAMIHLHIFSSFKGHTLFKNIKQSLLQELVYLLYSKLYMFYYF